jgi:hypothetical protein
VVVHGTNPLAALGWIQRFWHSSETPYLGAIAAAMLHGLGVQDFQPAAVNNLSPFLPPLAQCAVVGAISNLDEI